jgi:hypothetical protein
MQSVTQQPALSDYCKTLKTEIVLQAVGQLISDSHYENSGSKRVAWGDRFAP